jgi:crotonobetainyl-CoA:carnitine CoA-transferase CaiB-like acyl-CoA transferase
LLAPDRRPYRTRDGYICALIYTDKHWNAFFDAIGEADLNQRDPRFKDMSARTRNYDHVYKWLADLLETRTTAEWMDLFEKADIPCGPMHDLDSLIDDPHLSEVGFFREIDHPTEGRLRVAGPAARWSRTPSSIRSHPPLLGEHGDEILREAGFSDSDIEALAGEGAMVRHGEIKRPG